MKDWQKISLAIFGAFFLMFTTTALLRDDWVLWVYPGVTLVGVAITLYDGPGRKQRKQEEAMARALAEREELQRAKRLERQARKRRKKGDG